jgi:hypothetical protein
MEIKISFNLSVANGESWKRRKGHFEQAQATVPEFPRAVASNTGIFRWKRRISSPISESSPCISFSYRKFYKMKYGLGFPNFWTEGMVLSLKTLCILIGVMLRGQKGNSFLVRTAFDFILYFD